MDKKKEEEEEERDDCAKYLLIAIMNLIHTV